MYGKHCSLNQQSSNRKQGLLIGLAVMQQTTAASGPSYNALLKLASVFLALTLVLLQAYQPIFYVKVAARLQDPYSNQEDTTC